MTSPERGLRAYLRQKALALRASASATPRGDDWREAIEVTVTASDVTGVRRLRMGERELVGDSGPRFGGYGLGPSSPELLCGVIGTCLAHIYEIGAARFETPLDRIEVRVTALNNDARLLGLETDDPPVPWELTAHIAIEAGGVPANEVERLHRWVAENCPLTNLVRNPAELRLVVE